MNTDHANPDLQLAHESPGPQWSQIGEFCMPVWVRTRPLTEDEKTAADFGASLGQIQEAGVRFRAEPRKFPRSLVVGDVLDQDSPQPPIGTRVRDVHTVRSGRFREGWRQEDGDGGWFDTDWPFVAEGEPLTVTRVGDGGATA